MARVQLQAETSYAYLGTLMRLDRNGDGVLSRTERAAEDKPGILKQLSDKDAGAQSPGTKLSANVLAFMLENGAYTDSNAAENNDLYAATYGQFDADPAALGN